MPMREGDSGDILAGRYPTDWSSSTNRMICTPRFRILPALHWCGNVPFFLPLLGQHPVSRFAQIEGVNIKLTETSIKLVERDGYAEIIRRANFDSSNIASRSGKRGILRPRTIKVHRLALITTAFSDNLCIAEVYVCPKRIMLQNLLNPLAFQRR